MQQNPIHKEQWIVNDKIDDYYSLTDNIKFQKRKKVLTNNQNKQFWIHGQRRHMKKI